MGFSSGTEASGPAATDLSYAQRVGAAFIAFIHFVDFLRSDHNVPASELDSTTRSKRGDEAVVLAISMQRAMLALMGTHRRRTYAHDLVYGIHQLYMLFGKLWNAATEGNEHAHQDMKKFFHDLTCHNPKAPKSSCFQVLRLTLVKRQLLQTKSDLLPQSNYAAMRANRVLQEDAEKRSGKKRGKLSGPKGLKDNSNTPGTDSKIKKCSQRITEQIMNVP
mgnify:CR=1 FL=1